MWREDLFYSEAIMKFISETNERIHKEELVRMKLRRSVFEKSYGREFKTLRDAIHARMPTGEREILRKLLTDILLHEIFFDSFGPSNRPSESVRRRYGSEASFLYELYESARCTDGGFLLIFGDERGKIDYYAGRDYIPLIERKMPCLALDLEEHSYFYDYLFERDSYIKAALCELNLSKI